MVALFCFGTRGRSLFGGGGPVLRLGKESGQMFNYLIDTGRHRLADFIAGEAKDSPTLLGKVGVFAGVSLLHMFQAMPIDTVRLCHNLVIRKREVYSITIQRVLKLIFNVSLVKFIYDGLLNRSGTGDVLLPYSVFRAARLRAKPAISLLFHLTFKSVKHLVAEFADTFYLLNRLFLHCPKTLHRAIFPTSLGNYTGRSKKLLPAGAAYTSDSRLFELAPLLRLAGSPDVTTFSRAIFPMPTLDRRRLDFKLLSANRAGLSHTHAMHHGVEAFHRAILTSTYNGRPANEYLATILTSARYVFPSRCRRTFSTAIFTCLKLVMLDLIWLVTDFASAGNPLVLRGMGAFLRTILAVFVWTTNKFLAALPTNIGMKHNKIPSCLRLACSIARLGAGRLQEPDFSTPLIRRCLSPIGIIPQFQSVATGG